MGRILDLLFDFLLLNFKLSLNPNLMIYPPPFPVDNLKNDDLESEMPQMVMLHSARDYGN